MSLLDQARNKAGSSDVTPWKPTEKGDGVEGRVLSVDHIPSDFPAPDGTRAMIPVVTLELADGSKAGVRGYHSVLRRELETEAPKIGDLLACVYMGTDTIKNGTFKGREVHIYRVVVQKATAAGTDTPSVITDPPF